MIGQVPIMGRIAYRRSLAGILPACAMIGGFLACGVAVAAKAEKEAPRADSAEAPPRAADLGEGRLIRVRLPLTGNADAHIRSSIQRVVAQLSRLPRREGHRPTLILELVPQRRDSYGEGTDFTRA